MTAANGQNKQETRLKLLRTAMQLYAKDGLHGVSLRAISAASGSRNSAAMHYHFTNRSGVMQALLDMIYGEVSRLAKEQNLAGKVRACNDLREAMRLTLMPLVTLSREIEWGPDAIVLLARILAEADEELAHLNNRYNQSFYQYADTELARLLPELNAQSRRLRLIFMTVNIFHGFADLAALAHTPFGDLSTIDDDQLLEELVDYLHNGLTGP